jgi:hypothetical protein
VTINHSFRTYQIWDEDGNYHDSDIPEREANRALIEAAPFLLETLKSISQRTVDDTVAHIARAAIAKAIGAA